jgi:stage II sporulation protein D
MKTFYAITFISIGLFVFPAGCTSEPANSEPVITHSPPVSGIKVLLNDNAEKISFKSDDDYRILNYDTMETLKVAVSSDLAEITTDNNSIRVGPQNFKTTRLIIQTQHNRPFVINDNQAYRGNLEVIVNPDNKTMMVINNVSLESYLAGVVAAEMPSYWETEVLKAQAIAARTYCLYMKSKFGKNRFWDVKATQANQVYKGIRAETLRTTNAVNSTAGLILCSEQESGCEQFPAYYSSACGGHTENSANVFGDSFEPLRGVDCPFCRTTIRPSLFFWPDVKFDKKTVNENILERYPSLKDLGKIEKIETEIGRASCRERV